MAIDASKFSAATPQNSGVVDAHLRAIHGACQDANCFLILRPSTVPTMRLIAAGFATKSMDVHDKSSDFGPMSGLVPCDQAFCKAPKGAPTSNPHYHGHGQAQVIHLSLGNGLFDQLNGQSHFEQMTELTIATPSVDPEKKYRHFLSPKSPTVHFAMERQTGNVYWYPKALTEALSDATAVPLYVWGYKGTPVTGDYDMWMVVPHVSTLGGKTDINSVKDAHGRSAASGFVSAFIPQLNTACGREEKPVFNHGAEAQNVSFTQAMDRYLVMFFPGSMPPVMMPRMVIPGVLHDMLLHGYLAVRNPKWLNGSTLGIEDMADAAEQFPDDAAVKGGVAARKQLELNAAKHIQNVFKNGPLTVDPSTGTRVKGDSEGWLQRYEQLRHFRALGGTADVNEIRECLMLPAAAFPKWGAGSDADVRDDAQRMAREAERKFGRTGFVKDGGHVSPVDQSRNGPSVASLRQLWEPKKLR